MLQSVDVSWPQKSYQPGGESGVFVAATSGDGGTLFTQSTFAVDVANARAVGKEVGFYHFNGPQDAAASADYFWSVIAAYYRPGDGVGLDIESYNGGTAPAQSPAWAAAFLTRLGQHIAGLHALVYGNRSVMSQAGWGALQAAGHFLWLAAPGGYPENTPIGEWSKWTILQFSSAGGVDRDESELTFAQIAGAPTLNKVWEEADMLYIYNPTRGGGIVGPFGFYKTSSAEAGYALLTYGTPADSKDGKTIVGGTIYDVATWDNARQTALNIGAQFATAVAAQINNLDASKVAAAVVAALPAQASTSELTTAQVTAAVEAGLQALTLKAVA